ncbi:hypothetical protein GP486_003325 [Trichoglossum hirsutum]|uniref:Uncharacterized protein n=1 Tax=Trichoglossum hirsutum TaxID=265104 RepID=A0A9P8LD47_9PEZI|nr:hypothetical protein GP486_003325 [Trichoglossum hirsutum]
MGYWGGISPIGKINDTYKCVDVKVGDNTLRVVDATDVSRLYTNFYKFLWECRVDSAKTDAQFYLDGLVHADDRRQLTNAYQDAWFINSLRWLSGRAISCMSQTPQTIFHSQLPSTRPRMVVRNSDDFFPNVPESHPWHIFCNAHNSTFTSHFNVLPDWDMFQTSHPYASFHAAARCISGGPVYITDEVGKHDVELISQMTARTARENTVILRPDLAGKTIEPYTSYDEERLLKVGNFASRGGTGTSLLAVFNVSNRSIVELIPLRNFLGICGDEEYIIRAHSTGEISKILPGDSQSETSLVVSDLSPRGWEIFSAYPLQIVQHGSGDNRESLKIATLGLLGKMTGAVAVLKSEVHAPNSSSGRLKIVVSLRALGKLGLYMSNLSRKSIENDFIILLLGHVIPQHTVAKSAKVPELLEIDVERAWEEMNLSSLWNNEVNLQIYVNL